METFEVAALRARIYLGAIGIVGMCLTTQAIASILILSAAAGFFFLCVIRWMLLRRYDAAWRALEDALHAEKKEIGDAADG